MANDISIATGIIVIFIIIGVLLPYINEAFSNEAENFNTAGLESGVVDSTNTSPTSAYNVFLSVLSMFFWTFGNLPFWLDAIFIIFRIMLALIIGRNIWIGGGA